MFKKILFLVITLSLTVSLFGQDYYKVNRFEPQVIDARAMAIGRTSVLTTSGADNLFYNPALLSDLSGMELQISSKGELGFYDIDGNNHEYEYPLNIKLKGFALSGTPQENYFEDLKFVYGIGYRYYYDWGYHLKIIDNSDQSNDFEKNSKGGFSAAVLGGGVQYKNNLYFGCSYSLSLFSKYEFVESYDLEGSFFTFSSTYLLNKRISLGGRLRTGFDLEQKMDESDEGADQETIYRIPYELAFSVMFSPKQDLKIYLEYLTRKLGDYKIKVKEVHDDYNNLNWDSKSGYSIRGGFESGKDYFLRGGFFVQSDPVYKIVNDFPFSGDEPQTEIGVTSGIGFNLSNKVYLDSYLSYSFLIYANEYDNYQGEVYEEHFYNMFEIGCSLRYFFYK